MDKELGNNVTKVMLSGKEYCLSPITIGLLGELTSFIREKPIRDVYRQIEEYKMPEKYAEKAIQNAYRTVALDNRKTQELLDTLKDREDFEGILHLVYLRMKPNHPELETNTISNMPLNDILDLFDIFTDMGDEVDPEAQKKIARLERKVKKIASKKR